LSASSSSSTPSMERPRRRRRPAFSCLECRRRKIKCDRKDPCSHCVSVAIQCVHKTFRDASETSNQLQPVQSSTQGRAAVSSSADTPSPRAQSRQPCADRIVNEKRRVPARPLVARADISRPTPAPTPAGQTEATTAQAPPTTRVEDEQPSIHALLRRIQHLENSLAAGPVPAHSEPGGNLIDRQTVHQDTRVSLYKTRTIKWSYWVGMANEVWSTVTSFCYFALTSTSV
jgi:hypothetical protein